jgi:hypothetical protein
MAQTRKVGFLVSDFQFDEIFVCAETDDSLDMCGLRQGAYVVFELHTENNGARDARNLRLAIDDEIVAYMPRCEPSVNSVKNTDFDLLGGLVVEVQARRGLPQKRRETSSPHSSDMSSVEDADVRDSVWLVRVRPFCIGFTRFQ